MDFIFHLKKRKERKLPQWASNVICVRPNTVTPTTTASLIHRQTLIYTTGRFSTQNQLWQIRCHKWMVCCMFRALWFMQRGKHRLNHWIQSYGTEIYCIIQRELYNKWKMKIGAVHDQITIWTSVWISQQKKRRMWCSVISDIQHELHL